MENFSWVSGRGIELALAMPLYVMQRYSGIEGPPADIQTQKAPFQDGATLLDVLLEPRQITLEITALGENNQHVYDLRRELIRAFNPKSGIGRLTWTQRNGRSYEIDAVPDSMTPMFPAGDGRGWDFQTVVIELRALDPTWYDPDVQEFFIGSFEGGFAFPLVFPVSFGEIGSFLEVTNEGDIETPLQFIFEGLIANPIITKVETGEFIAVNATVQNGQRLEINTAFGQKSVVLVHADGTRESAFQFVDPESTFFLLSPGTSTISYVATDEGTEASAYIRFRHRFVGV
jgi:hypothetical protein